MRFRTRLILFLLIVSAVAVVLPGVIQYYQGLRLIKQSFGEHALQIATLGVKSLEGYDLNKALQNAIRVHEQKFGAAEALEEPVYQQVRAQLESIRQQTGSKFVYLLTRNNEKKLIYVADAGTGETFADSESLPGDSEPEMYPLAHRTFDTAEPSVGEYTEDTKWGSNVTTYVPVFHTVTDYPLVLAVDFDALVIRGMFQQQQTIIFIVTLSVVVLVLIMSWFFAASVSRPVQQIAAACRKVMNGDWRMKELEDVKGSLEFRELTDTFRKMVSEVRIREIESRNKELEEQQVHLGQVMSDLEAVKDGVQRGSRFLKHALLHDLGLMAIFAEKIGSSLPADAGTEVQEDLLVIQQKQQRLAGLIERLDLMTSEIKIRPETINVESWVSELIAGKQPLLDEKNVSVMIHGPSDAVVYADRFHLSEVIYNLIQNSVDAMNQSNIRQLSVRWKGDKDGLLWLKVRDSGAGVPADQLGQLKELFFTTKQGGNHFGMGLYYCEQVMNQHHGLIAIDSEPGAGTTVTLYFPSSGNGGMEDDSDFSGGR